MEQRYHFFNYLCWPDLPLRVLYHVHNEEQNPNAHEHSFYELVLVREGHAHHFMNGELVPIRAGSLFLVPPGKPHCYQNPQALGIYNILFAEELLNYFRHDLANHPNYQMLFHLQPELPSGMRTKTDMLTLDHTHFPDAVKLADGIIREQEQKESGACTAALGGFLALIAYLIRHARIAGSAEKTHCVYQIGRLLAEMEQNCAKEWTLQSMAAFVRMSQSSFRQQFRLITGQAPVTCLLHLRIQKAALLLKLSGTIGEIAEQVGFQDSNYFTRQFHAFYGISPREYKKRFSR